MYGSQQEYAIPYRVDGLVSLLYLILGRIHELRCYMESVTKQLHEIRQETLQILRSCSDEELHKHVTDSSWSVAQTVEHICLMDAAVSKLMMSGLHGSDAYEGREKSISKATDRSVKVQAPRAVQPSDTVWTKAELVDMVESTHHTLVQAHETLDATTLQRAPQLPHPIFGKLTFNQWFEFVGYHEQRHIRQIREILDELKFG